MSQNNSRCIDSTSSLLSLFQCWTAPSMNKFFPTYKLNVPPHNLRPSPPVLSPARREQGASLQGAVESGEVSPEPPEHLPEHPQLPQPLPQLCCPSADTKEACRGESRAGPGQGREAALSDTHCAPWPLRRRRHSRPRRAATATAPAGGAEGGSGPAATRPCLHLPFNPTVFALPLQAGGVCTAPAVPAWL